MNLLLFSFSVALILLRTYQQFVKRHADKPFLFICLFILSQKKSSNALYLFNIQQVLVWFPQIEISGSVLASNTILCCCHNHNDPQRHGHLKRMTY